MMPLSTLPRLPTTLRAVMLALDTHVKTALGWSTDIFWHTLEDEMPRVYPSIPPQGYYCTISYGGSEYDDSDYAGGVLAERATITFTMYARSLKDQRNRDDQALLPPDEGMYDCPEKLLEALAFTELLDENGQPFLRDQLQPLGRTPVVGQSWEGDHGSPFELLYSRLVVRAHFVRLIATH